MPGHSEGKSERGEWTASEHAECSQVVQQDKMVPGIPSSDFQASDASKGAVRGAVWVRRV